VVGAQSENRPIPLLPSQKFSTKCPYPTATCDLRPATYRAAWGACARQQLLTGPLTVSCRVVSAL
jgi:hypothetical protein